MTLQEVPQTANPTFAYGLRISQPDEGTMATLFQLLPYTVQLPCGNSLCITDSQWLSEHLFEDIACKCGVLPYDHWFLKWDR